MHGTECILLNVRPNAWQVIANLMRVYESHTAAVRRLAQPRSLRVVFYGAIVVTLEDGKVKASGCRPNQNVTRWASRQVVL